MRFRQSEKEKKYGVASCAAVVTLLTLLLLVAILPLVLNRDTTGITFSSAAQASGSSNIGKEVVVIQLFEQIDSGSASMISRGVARAQADKAYAVIIDMNTPGGLLSDMITMIGAINSSKVPVYTFVGNESSAASAGSYVAMSTVKIYMGAGSVIGPSTPIVVGGTSLDQSHVENYTLSLMESLAQGNGRNASAVAPMVTDNVAYGDAQAVALHVADGFSYNLDQTLSLINATGASIITVSENLTESAVSFLSNGTVDGILILIGIIAITLDFLHPTILLSIAGAVLIALGIIGAEAIQGPAGSPEIAVPIVFFALAAALIVLEIKTGHGFMLFAGVIVGVIGIIFLYYDIPYSPSPIGDVQYTEIAILIIAGGMLALYARWIGKALRKKPMTGLESLIGSEAIVSTDLSPEGEVNVDGVVWRARLARPEIGLVAKGEIVVILKMVGLTLVVDRKA